MGLSFSSINVACITSMNVLSTIGVNYKWTISDEHCICRKTANMLILQTNCHKIIITGSNGAERGVKSWSALFVNQLEQRDFRYSPGSQMDSQVSFHLKFTSLQLVLVPCGGRRTSQSVTIILCVFCLTLSDRCAHCGNFEKLYNDHL